MGCPRQSQPVGEESLTMKFYPDGLTSTQMQVIQMIAPFVSERHFYLAGGTALTIFLRHRQSLDLDWFTPQRLLDPMGLAQALRQAGVPFSTGQTAPGTLHGQIEDLRVSFFEYHYPLLSPLAHWQTPGIYLASLDDLACMKLSAIAQRGSKKDFFDIYALCQAHRSLEQLLERYLQKFSVTDIGPVLYGLVYYDDADAEPDPLMLNKITWLQVKSALRDWVKAIH
jgi:hypothetical protein